MASCRPLVGLVLALRGLVSASYRPYIGLSLAFIGLDPLLCKKKDAPCETPFSDIQTRH
jgi:hypothetical protein